MENLEVKAGRSRISASVIQFIKNLATMEKVRYLSIGALNTLVGYFVTTVLYLLLAAFLHLIVIAILANIVSITISFLTYKLFVFRTRGHWLAEYCRCYLVYGGGILLSILLLWLLISQFHFNIWLGQALAMIVVVIVSYFLHSKYTFMRRTKS